MIILIVQMSTMGRNPTSLAVCGVKARSLKDYPGNADNLSQWAMTGWANSQRRIVVCLNGFKLMAARIAAILIAGHLPESLR
jgi:hypothetical protein